MTRSCLLFSLFLFLLIKVVAQNNLPTAYEITADTAISVTLENTYSQMLEDPQGKWTIDEVSNLPIVDKFHFNTTKAKGVDYSINTFWFRYHIKNNMNREARIAITEEDITYADFYTRTSNEEWDHKITGAFVPWSKRNDLKGIKTLTYIIPPGKELFIYKRNKFDYFISAPYFFQTVFGFTDNVLKHNYNDNDPSILPSFLFGLFLLAAIFNLYFFLIVRQRVYLFFSLTLLCRGYSRFLDSNDFFFREHPMLKWHLSSFIDTFYFFFLIHFLRYFLLTSKYFPRWDKYLIGLSIYIIIFSYIEDQYFIIPIRHIDIFGPFIVSVSILITLVMLLRFSGKDAWLAIVASLPIICITAIPTLLPAFVDDRFVTFEQIGVIWLLVFFSWSLFQRYQQLQKTIAQEAIAKERLAKEREMERSLLIEQQKITLEKTVEDRTTELKQSLQELRTTQAQLIHSGKMASLGELTAGIAHEIQNPLNFVNNFSEVNTELISELNEQIEKGNLTEIRKIANDINENEQKIGHHGKRADSIVKGMLQHSRTSTGQKEPTDINSLADEYLRLAYHGLRAKEKHFNATIKTDFDTSIGPLNLVSQDIGRVLLNLYNNAFYAVSEKKKTDGGGFEPTVSVSTKKANDKIEISVKDNGGGIPQKILDKIFQPFFTTKPTGQGTGLGLSLAYDIIKAHGGEIKVETKEGEGSEFIIQLPTQR